MARRSGLRRVNRLRRLLRRLPDDAKIELRSVVKDWAEAVEADAKNNAPIDEGDLRSSISHKFNRDGLSARIGFLTKKDQKQAFYAPFIHFGTIKRGPNPFLYNAAKQNRDWGKQRAKAAVTRALQKASRGAGGDD